MSTHTGLDAGLLRTSVIEALPVTDTDALGRACARDRRDDLDRGQHLPPPPPTSPPSAPPGPPTAQLPQETPALDPSR